MTQEKHNPTTASTKALKAATAHNKAFRACAASDRNPNSPVLYQKAVTASALAHRASLDALEAGTLAFYTNPRRGCLTEQHEATLTAASANEKASRAQSPTDGSEEAQTAHRIAADAAFKAYLAWDLVDGIF